jgi:hypothetical protein
VDAEALGGLTLEPDDVAVAEAFDPEAVAPALEDAGAVAEVDSAVELELPPLLRSRFGNKVDAHKEGKLFA